MTTATHYAAIDATNISGAIYGVGTTPEAALAEALAAGDPCVTHELDDRLDPDRRDPSHTPADHFAVVPCTAAAFAFIDRHGGAFSPELTVTTRDGVSLRSEEE
jgi:hypothetical protein